MSKKSKAPLIPPDNAPSFNSDLPDANLKIKAVFGYAGDTRGNLTYNNENQIVYFSAGTGVIADREGNQKYHYGHTNDISAFCIDNTKSFVATGDMTNPGSSPVIRIWNPSSGKPIANIKGKDGSGVVGHLLDKQIVDITFSNDSTKLAAMGDDNNHELTILETSDNWSTWSRIKNRTTTTNKIYFCIFYKNDYVYYGGEKVIFRYDIGSDEVKKVLFGSYDIDVFYCALQYQDNILAGTKGGNIYIIQGTNIINSINGHGNSSVNCLSYYMDTFMSGGNDKKINVWSSDFSDINNTISLDDEISKITNVSNCLISGINALAANADGHILVGTKRCNIIELIVNDNSVESASMIAEGHAHCEVWGCSANPLDPNTVVSVGDDKDLFIWDLTTKLPRTVIHLPKKSRSVDFHPTDGLLAVGLGAAESIRDPTADDGGFMVININTLSTTYEKIKMSNEWISAVKWSPDGKYLVVGSHDNYIYIYDARNKFKLLSKFTKGTSFVLQCDFSTDSKLLRVCYGDYQLLYCEIPSGTHFLDATEIGQKEWHTNNCIIGWGVQGIWADTNDKTDINACCTNPNNTLLCAVDDNNVVRLYRFPCLNQTAKFKKFYGHSSHIPYAEFSFDGTGLVTCGGNDHTVIYWSVV